MSLLVQALKIGGAAAVQSSLLIGIWITAVGYARSQNRFPPTLFEFTFTIGLMAFAIATLICSVFAFVTRSRRHSMLIVFGSVLAWLLIVLPSAHERPVAIPVFTITGAGILILFSGLILPRLTWFKYNKPNNSCRTNRP